MRKLLAATCLTPFIAVTAASPLLAETVINDARTTAISTSSVNDSIRISTTGSIKPASGTVAVTKDSSHSVTNQGTIAFTGVNDSTGIVIVPGNSGDVTNSGTITIDENFTPTDTDSDGDVDGPFAQGSGRFGIHLLSGGALTGNILNSGTITIEGNASGGIVLDGSLTGNLTHSGTISVTGNDSVGIKTNAVSGNVALTNGTISVKGANSVGLDVAGAVGGSLSIQSGVTATGYRATTAPIDTSKLDADDLLQGGPAVRVAADVAGGIIVDTRPADNSTTDTDEDDDGIIDANEGNGSIVSYGSAPALQVGSSAQDVSVGALASSSAGHGFVNKGAIGGFGVYKGVSATGVSFGGLGHTVNIAGGMTNSGTIAAKSIEANSTALQIGAGASIPSIVNSGTIASEGAGAAATSTRAIDIAAGATVGTIKNSGTISALRTGTDGTAYAIFDRSGTVSLIENSGQISVANATTLGDKAIAFDLSANAGGATVKQLAVAATATAPAIRGTMIFGAGNDTLDLADGSATGAAKFGAGTDTLNLSGDSVLDGNVTFGAGSDSVSLSGTSRLNGGIDFAGAASTLTLGGTSVFSGTLSNSGGVAVTVGAGSSLNAANQGTIQLASLSTGSGSTLGVSIDGQAGTHTFYDVSGAVTIGGPTTLAVNLDSVDQVAGSYVVISGSSLTGANQLSSTVGLLPYLFDSSVTSDALTNDVTLTIRQKTADELGLNRSEAAILGAVIGAVDSDAAIADVFLSIEDQEGLRSTLQQMLPDHAGGTFETVTKGTRLAARYLADPIPASEVNGWNVWLQQVAWGSSKSIGDTSSYDLTAWGATGGVEVPVGPLGCVGLSVAYLTGTDGDDGDSIRSNHYEAALSWRGGKGPLRGFARVAAGRVNFKSDRLFSAPLDAETVTRTAEGDWNGTLFSAIGGASYDLRFGRFSLRPVVQLEYFRLKEKGYSEKNGGTAFDLTVDGRSSNETAASATLAAGYDLIQADMLDRGWMRVEIEGGRRQILSGKLGSTTAQFEGGNPFTLDPEQRSSGWQARLRLAGGGAALSLAGEVEAEEQQGKAAIGGRVSLRFGL